MAIFPGNKFGKQRFIFAPRTDYGKKRAQAAETRLSYQSGKLSGNRDFKTTSFS